MARRWFGQQPVSLATTPGGVVFPRGTEMFQFPRFPPPIWRCAAITLRGLPHSETVGSMGGSPSPTLSLLTGVLHRLVLPRHSPTAPSVLPGLWHLGCQKMVLDYKTLDPMNRSILFMNMMNTRCYALGQVPGLSESGPLTSDAWETCRGCWWERTP